jgi:hypothetical protein
MAIVTEVQLSSKELRQLITLKVKLPPMFYLRMRLTTWIIRLAALIAWCHIEIEFVEEKKSED